MYKITTNQQFFTGSYHGKHYSGWGSFADRAHYLSAIAWACIPLRGKRSGYVPQFYLSEAKEDPSTQKTIIQNQVTYQLLNDYSLSFLFFSSLFVYYPFPLPSVLARTMRGS